MASAVCTFKGCPMVLVWRDGAPQPSRTCWKHTRSRIPENETVAEKWRRITGRRA